MTQELTEEYIKELRSAVLHNQADKVEEMLQDADIKAISEYRLRGGRGNTLLMEAVRLGNEEVMDVMLKKGIDPNVAGGNGSKALGLYFAMATDEKALAQQQAKANRINQKLINAGAVDETGEYTKSPLVQAIEANDVAKVKELVAEGVDVNAENKDGKPLWEKAIRKPEIFETLAKAGMNLESPNSLGHTALMNALYDNNNKVAQICLDNGADVHAKSQNSSIKDYTPLHFATTPEMVQKLIEKGADVNAETKDGTTPIWGKSVECMEILRKAGANIHVNVDGMNLMSQAAFGNEIEKVKYLQNLGFDINEPDKTGFTPLMWAAIDKNEAFAQRKILRTEDVSLPFIQQMIELGAKASVIGKDGHTAAALAGEKQPEIREFLITTAKQEQAGLKQELHAQATISQTLGNKKIKEAQSYQKPQTQGVVSYESSGSIQSRKAHERE